MVYSVLETGQVNFESTPVVGLPLRVVTSNTNYG